MSSDSDLSDEEIDSDEFGGSSSDEEDDDGATFAGAHWGQARREKKALPGAWNEYNAEISDEEESSDGENEAFGAFGAGDDEYSSDPDSLDSAEEEALMQAISAKLGQGQQPTDADLERVIKEYMSKYPDYQLDDTDTDTDASDSDCMHLLCCSLSFHCFFCSFVLFVSPLISQFFADS
jgi:hypothetical protein